MATRNPTSYVQYQDLQKMKAGEPILSSVVDEIWQDLTYILDAPQLVYTKVYNFVMDETAGAAVTQKTIKLRLSKDMCDVDSVSNNEISCDWYALVWSSDAATDGTITIDSTATSGGTDTQTIDGSVQTTPTWIGSSTFNVKTDANTDTIILQLHVTAGAGTVYCGGLAIFATET